VTRAGGAKAVVGRAVKLSPFEWLAINGRKAQFRHSAACHITGLSADTFKNWETRGIISTERLSHGVYRKYCGHDLIIFGLAGKLVQLGLGAKDSAQVALHIWRELLKPINRIRRGKVRRPSNFSNATAFISSAGRRGRKKVRIEFGQIRVPAQNIQGGEPVIVFPCGRVVSSIAAKACKYRVHERRIEEKLGEWEIQDPLTRTRA
jgi:hypothetical protein